MRFTSFTASCVRYKGAATSGSRRYIRSFWKGGPGENFFAKKFSPGIIFIETAMSKHALALVVPEAERISALMAFSLRAGGVSEPPLDSLNFSVSQGDSPGNVLRNLETLGAFLDIDPSKLVTCRQVHGDTVATLEAVPCAPPEADAIISLKHGVFPAVKTADCLPILLLDPVTGISAAIHAGWKGTVLRITRKVLRVLEGSFDVRPQDVIAALGPAIGPCCYEVDDKVLDPLAKAMPGHERFVAVIRKRNGEDPAPVQSRRLNLAEANRFELVEGGVLTSNIFSFGLCTACRPDLLFSHRRDGALSGRHIAVVGFR